MEYMVEKSINSRSYYALMVLFLLLPSVGFSQASDEEKKISLGFEIGPQFTNVRDSWSYSNLPEAKVGFNTGLFADYNIHSNFKLRGGLYFDNRRFQHEDWGPVAEFQSNDSIFISYLSYDYRNFDYNLNYLSIPLSIIYEKRSNKFSIYLQGSIYYSLLLSATKTGNTDLYIDPDHAGKFEDKEKFKAGHTITDYDREDVSTTFNSNDWGIQIYLGGIYHLNDRIGIHISPGFTLAFGNLYLNPQRDSGWKNVYKVNTGIIYTLK